MRYDRSLAIANRHERLIELIRFGEYSSPSLAQKLEVSEQTIYRDIGFFEVSGLFHQVRESSRWLGLPPSSRACKDFKQERIESEMSTEASYPQTYASETAYRTVSRTSDAEQPNG